MSDRRYLRNRIYELQPLAYAFERHIDEELPCGACDIVLRPSDLQVCHALHKEYRQLYDSSLRTADGSTGSWARQNGVLRPVILQSDEEIPE